MTTATLSQYQSAINRAIEHGGARMVKWAAEDGKTYLVQSSRDPNTRYTVRVPDADTYLCGCAAGLHQRGACVHRAAVWLYRQQLHASRVTLQPRWSTIRMTPVGVM